MTPSESRAEEEWPESVRGIPIAVPPAAGNKSWGTGPLTQRLRQTVSEAVGPLVPSKKFEQVQKKLGMRGEKALEPEALARAGKEAGAAYVLTVTVTRERFLHTARALLVNAATGEIQMDFRSQYYKPTDEAADRGLRIGKRAVLKLAELLQTSPPADAGGIASAPSEKVDDSSVASATPPAKRDERGKSDKVDDGERTRSTPLPQPRASQNERVRMMIAKRARHRHERRHSGAEPSGTASPEPTTTATADVERSGVAPEWLRFVGAAGASWMHTYTLSSPDVAKSKLSYVNGPRATFFAEAELVVPGAPIDVRLRGAIRPARYDIRIPNEEPKSISGFAVDSSGFVGYRLVLSGSRQSPTTLTPALGARFAMSTGEDVSNALLSHQSFAPMAALHLGLPINDVLELRTGVDGGLLLSYSEKPATNGTFDGGFALGAELAARVWVLESPAAALGIAFDLRFDMERIGFSGTASRKEVGGEGKLTDASLATMELLVGDRSRRAIVTGEDRSALIGAPS